MKTQNISTSTFDNKPIPDIMTLSHLRDAEIVRLSRSGFQGAAIGRRVGLTRARISQILKRANQPQAAKRGFRFCAWCGTQFLAFPCQTRKYCSIACVGAAKNKSVVQWRQGQRIAREIVSKHFNLQPEHIVHHEDKNNRNNDIANLLVFASQADHMAYHHGSEVKPLWDGREFSQGVTL